MRWLTKRNARIHINNSYFEFKPYINSYRKKIDISILLYGNNYIQNWDMWHLHTKLGYVASGFAI